MMTRQRSLKYMDLQGRKMGKREEGGKKSG